MLCKNNNIISIILFHFKKNKVTLDKLPALSIKNKQVYFVLLSFLRNSGFSEITLSRK